MSNVKLGMKAGRPSSTKSSPTLAGLANKGDTVRVNFDLDRAQHIKLKIHAAKTSRSITDILRELVNSIN